MSEIYQPEEDSYLLSKVLEKEIPKLLKKNSKLKVLEIGCGSGIQIKKILKFSIKKENVFCCDINKDAVKECKKLKVFCVKSNLFKKIKEKFDLIIFNPPYLPEDENEPKGSQLATTGGKTGGELINKFLKEAKKYLNKEGNIFLLISSLTKKINFKSYKKRLLGKKKIFFEELYVWKLSIA